MLLLVLVFKNRPVGPYLEGLSNIQIGRGHFH